MFGTRQIVFNTLTHAPEETDVDLSDDSHLCNKCFLYTTTPVSLSLLFTPALLSKQPPAQFPPDTDGFPMSLTRPP